VRRCASPRLQVVAADEAGHSEQVAEARAEQADSWHLPTRPAEQRNLTGANRNDVEQLTNANSSPAHAAGWRINTTRLMTTTCTKPMRLPRAMLRWLLLDAMNRTWKDRPTNSSPVSAAAAPTQARKEVEPAFRAVRIDHFWPGH